VTDREHGNNLSSPSDVVEIPQFHAVWATSSGFALPVSSAVCSSRFSSQSWYGAGKNRVKKPVSSPAR
jgi:hypothetical protein